MRPQKIHALVLVLLLLALSFLSSLSLQSYFPSAISGYSIAESWDKKGGELRPEAKLLYILGAVVIILLSVYSLLLWKHYF